MATILGESGFVGQHLKQYAPATLPVIFNLASMSSVEYSIEEPAYVISNNIECMLDALEQARKSRRLFIHLSTVEATRPSNPYAASKTAQEAIARAYFNTYGVKVIIARSHNIIGEGQAEDKYIPKLINQIKAGEIVEIYGNGSRIYNPIRNVIHGLLALADYGEPGHTYLIGGGRRMTNIAMAKKVAKLLDKPLKYRLVSGRPGYKKALKGQGEKIPGWRPPYTLEEGMEWIR